MEVDLTSIQASSWGTDLIFIFMPIGYASWLGHWIQGSQLKNTEWLQGQLCLSFFGDQPNEYQELLLTLW